MVGIKRRFAPVFVAGVMVASTVGIVATAGPASAAVTPQTGPAGALAIAQAIATPSAHLTGASFETTTGGTPNGTSDSALGEFPTDNSTFGILTTGNVSSVPQPGTFANTSNGGPNVRGNTDLDVTVLKADVNVPAGSNCLAFDFKFMSEEYPQFVGQTYNDAFIAELDSSTWTTAGSAITAPNNFAFDSAGEVVSINSTGIGGLTAADGAGTAFDSSGPDTRGAATGLLHAAHQITPGAHSVYFSIFDQQDDAYDSAAFLDNLVVGFVPNPAVNCAPGASPVNYTLDLTPASGSSPAGTQHTVTATLTDSNGAPVGGVPINFTVAGANPGTDTVSTDEGGQADFTYTGTNAGTDQIAACYDADNEPPCEVTASATQVWSTPVGLTVDSSLDPNPVTAGNQVLDTATVSATGVGTAHNVSATVSGPGGTAISATTSQGTCAPAAGANVTCTIGDLAAGNSATINARFSAPSPVPVGGTYSVTTNAQSDEVDPVSDVATATVVAKSNTSSDGYVPPGGTLKVGPNSPTTGINTVAAFTLPNTGAGAPISLDTLAAPAGFCGGDSCRGKVVQLGDFEGYHDPLKPPALVLRFDKTVAVNKLVATVYAQKTPDGPIFVVPPCAPRPGWTPLENLFSALLVYYGLGPHSFYASPSPCVNAKWLSADGDLNVTILALSGDPKIGFK